jgi:hypothetical protein
MTCKLVRGLAILNTCVKFRQNRSRNKVARAMTRQDHTYIVTYVHTYVHTYVRARTYIPPTTSLLEGIIINLILVSENGILNFLHYMSECRNYKDRMLFSCASHASNKNAIDCLRPQHEMHLLNNFENYFAKINFQHF